MLNEFIIIILLSISSYLGFKIYIHFGILKISQKDEFANFLRQGVQTGSGIVFLIIFLIFMYIFNFFEFFEISFPKNFLFFIVSITLITVLSFLDDKYKLDPLLRFSVHLLTAYTALSSVPHIVEFLPTKPNILIALLIWVYIINISNFVDGADGFCTIIALSFFINSILICHFIGLINFSLYISIILIPILSIFIMFNSPPAKLFMGDTGAIFLGFLIGYIVIEISHSKNFILIISAYAYPLLDVTITLFKRIQKGFAPWRRLGDFYFLLPKKSKNYKINFVELEKKILYFIICQSLFSILIIFIALKFNFHYLSFLNFLSAVILIKVFSNLKN